jgi:prepilin-type N-terminal cleavage/methylation domain-containing protein
MKRERGFSLVELSIVLVIVGLLIGGLLTPLSVQVEQRRISDTQRELEETKEALLGFAIRNGYLPCPAISATNGIEHRLGSACVKRSGYIPWATLGVSRLDAWGRIYRYSVTPAFAHSQFQFTLGTARDITVAGRDPQGRLSAVTGMGDIPAVVLSHGKNGFGAVSDSGIAVAGPVSGNADERVNAGVAGTAFVHRTLSDNPAAPGGQFDDLLTWVSPNVLFNRMVAAGTLPR